MIDLGRKGHFGGLERVVGREVDVQEEDSASVRTLIRTHDRCLPVELVCLVGWASTAIGWWVPTQVNQFFLDSLQSHFFNQSSKQDLLDQAQVSLTK